MTVIDADKTGYPPTPLNLLNLLKYFWLGAGGLLHRVGKSINRLCYVNSHSETVSNAKPRHILEQRKQ
jgi:hypothetical protein